MKLTNKQGKALELAFNSGLVRNMEPQEYNEYLQLLLSLSLQTTRANNGDQFVKEFVNAALSDQVPPVVKQTVQH